MAAIRPEMVEKLLPDPFPELPKFPHVKDMDAFVAAWEGPIEKMKPPASEGNDGK